MEIAFPLILVLIGVVSLANMLLRRGYSDEDIRKILGGDVLRVLADVEAVAADLSEETRE